MRPMSCGPPAVPIGAEVRFPRRGLHEPVRVRREDVELVRVARDRGHRGGPIGITATCNEPPRAPIGEARFPCRRHHAAGRRNIIIAIKNKNHATYENIELLCTARDGPDRRTVRGKYISKAATSYISKLPSSRANRLHRAPMTWYTRCRRVPFLPTRAMTQRCRVCPCCVRPRSHVRRGWQLRLPPAATGATL